MLDHRLAAGLAIAAVLAAGDMPAAYAASVNLAPHRAVYDMVLGVSRNSASVTAVRGRMVYEMTGNACDGYTQNTRLVTEMTTSEGATTLSDLRSMTWEDAAGALMRFETTQSRDQKAAEATAGNAKRGDAKGPVMVELTRPEKSSVKLPAGTLYPVQHSIALIEAARASKKTMRADLYDGSEKGDKAYDTNARIGRKVDAAVIATLPPLKNNADLDKVAAWPVSISYFEPGKEQQDATPVYELSFLFFENGVSRKLVIDYGDFSIKGEISELTMLEPGKCAK